MFHHCRDDANVFERGRLCHGLILRPRGLGVIVWKVCQRWHRPGFTSRAPFYAGPMADGGRVG